MDFVAFTGAGGTGKSTIAQGFKFNIPSPVDRLRKEFYGNNAKFGTFTKFNEIEEWQTNLLYSAFSLENYAADIYGNYNDIVTIERSSIDYAAYFLNQASKFSKNQKCFEKIQDYVTRCIEHANSTYAYVIYFPIGKFDPGYTNDSSKERTLESIKKTDEFINSLLKRITVPILRLEPVKKVERVDAILRFTGYDA